MQMHRTSVYVKRRSARGRLSGGCIARIRYVGNSDYQRTERQREVLSKMMQEMKSSSVTELSALADTILPSVTHNIDQSTLMTLIGELPTILSYEIVQSRVPYDDLYSSKGEMLVPDFSATISRLQTEIYGLLP